MNLSIKIFISLILSVIAGLLLGEDNLPWLKDYVAPIGTMFINLIKMMIVPVVLSSLVCGVASLGDMKKLGRIGVKVIVLYLVTTAIAITLALVLASIVQPGTGMELTAAKAPDIKDAPTFMEVIVAMIPANPIMSMAKAEMLPIIVFALAIGIGITATAEKGEPLLKFFTSLADVSYKLIGLIMELAPYGVFALLVPALVVYSSIVSGLGKMSPIKFFKGLSETMLIGFTTCSSAAALPVNMRNCEENLGASKSVISFVLPLGATINMDGTAIYLGVCAIFIANVFGIDLTSGQMMMIVLTGTLASIGTAGVPGGGVIMLAMVLQSVGLPLEGIALVAGIDRVLDMARTCLNITGDAAVTVAISHMEK